MSNVFFVSLLICVVKCAVDDLLNTTQLTLYEHDDELLLLGRKPLMLLYKANNYMDHLRYQAKQNVLCNIVRKMISNDNFTCTGIDVDMSLSELGATYFWFSYVALVNYLDVFIELWGLMYISDKQTIQVRSPLRKREFKGDYYSMGIFIANDNDNICLNIYSDFSSELKLNYVGFINDPWDSIHIEFSNYNYNEKNEILFMQNINKWSLAPKRDFIINGLSCNIINYPCNFGFITALYSTFELTVFIRNHDYMPASIDICYVGFNNTLDTFNIKHAGSMTTIELMIPHTPLEFIRYVNLAGTVILHNIYGHLVRISDFIRKFQSINVNPFVMDFNFKAIARNSVLIYRDGFQSHLVIPLKSFYKLRHKGRIDIMNNRYETIIASNEFTCTKTIDKEIWKQYICEYKGYVIDIREQHQKVMDPVNEGCFQCLQAMKKKIHRNLIIWVYTTKKITFIDSSRY